MLKLDQRHALVVLAGDTTDDRERRQHSVTDINENNRGQRVASQARVVPSKSSKERRFTRVFDRDSRGLIA